jgi:Tfp pilus assembly protein PilV
LDNTIKTLIIIVVILVAVLGVAGGFILQGYLLNSNKNATSVNQTNASTNSSIDNTKSNLTSNKSTSTNSGFISSQKAIDIAQTMIESDPSNVYYTEFVNGLPYGSPHLYVLAS